MQGTIEDALARLLQEDIRIDGAGRTDRGVHARGQTASFSTMNVTMPPARLLHAANALLPGSIRLTSARLVPPEFHARFSALSREYRYFLVERQSAIDSRFAGCSRRRADLQAMERLAATLQGTHDFRSFSKESDGQHGTACTVFSARWYRYGRFLVFQVTANRFLRSMVRYLVAAMVDAGTGRMPEAEFGNLLAGGERPKGLVPASPSGLFLWKVLYP